MLDNWPTPLVIAHRGASSYAPENTLKAFQIAIEHRTDAIEFDVKLTSDQEVVVIHDTTVNRTTNGIGKVAAISLNDLKQLDAGMKFNESFAGERVPTLREVFNQLGNQVKMNIELTNYSTPNDKLVYKVIDLIKEFHLEEMIFFSSFYSWNLKIARKLIPEIPRGLLGFPGWLGFFARRSTSNNSFQALNINKLDITDQLVSACHTENKRVLVWTVNDEDEMRKFLKMDVDGIFTDDPGLLRYIIEN